MPKVEILHVTSDLGCELRVWVDGVEVDEGPDGFWRDDVDPGRGYSADEWSDLIGSTRLAPGFSPAFKAAALDAFEASSDSKYIEGGN